jgi:hypothetical protein
MMRAVRRAAPAVARTTSEASTDRGRWQTRPGTPWSSRRSTLNPSADRQLRMPRRYRLNERLYKARKAAGVALVRSPRYSMIRPCDNAPISKAISTGSSLRSTPASMPSATRSATTLIVGERPALKSRGYRRAPRPLCSLAGLGANVQGASGAGFRLSLLRSKLSWCERATWRLSPA